MAMLEQKPASFTATTFHAVSAASDLRIRVAEIADRLSGATPRTDAGGAGKSTAGESPADRGLLDQVDDAGRALHRYITDINADLDRITSKLG